MYVNDQTNSVPEGQFGDSYQDSENTGKSRSNESISKSKSSKITDELTDTNFQSQEKLIIIDNVENNNSNEKQMPVADKNDSHGNEDSKESGTIDGSDNIGETPEEVVGSEKTNNDEIRSISDNDVFNENKELTHTENIGFNKDKEDEQPKPQAKVVKEEGQSSLPSENKEVINYSLLSKSDLLLVLEEIISNRSVIDIRNDVENIKTVYYKKHRIEFEEKRKKFINEGGRPEDFKPAEDPEELQLRELLKKYRDLRIENSRYIEEEKQENLKKKYQVIEEIKELIDSQESINKTFQDFRELQSRWREIGVIPQASLNDLWKTYHHYVEKFYDYININKELRDLDLRKNLDEKIDLCEKAEALILEPNIISAFNALQILHEQWRETGPVPVDKRTEIWERFKEATSKINKKHQQYYQDIKEQQRKNLEQKTILSEKVESLLEKDYDSHKAWVKVTNEVLEIQKIWKTIGFAPKKENNKIYSRFRSACDRFFERKRDFYAQNMEEQNINLQKKLELCIQAEALCDSTDWKSTTDEMIRLQKKWKEIGPIPGKQSDAIWKRFRKACDKFFTNKSEYYKRVDDSYISNLEEKEKLIKEITDFVHTDDMKKNLLALQEFQRRWTEIGFVPLNKKNEIQQRYRDALNKHFDSLQVDELQKDVLKFESRIDGIMQKPHSNQKLRSEREKHMNKPLQLTSDISVWENNIGFFANNKNSEDMKRDFQKKIESAHQKIKLLEEKINLLDELDLDD